jgi:hypothetical protein
MERGSYLRVWISQGEQDELEKVDRYLPPVFGATSIISTLVSNEVLRASWGILRSVVAEGILVERIVLYGLGHWRCLVTVALSRLVTLLKSIVLNRLVHSLVAIAMAILRAVPGVSHLQEPLSVLFFAKRHFVVVCVVQEDSVQWRGSVVPEAQEH